MTTFDPSQVRLLILDVDGVLTDGSICIDDLGHETKRFHVRDGLGVKLWQKLGFQVAIITGRGGIALRHRARELGIDQIVQQTADKGAALSDLLHRLGLTESQAACIGDDWPELPIMARVAYPIAVADADERVKAAAAFTTTLPGGRGAVREAIEHLLTRKGLMDQALKLYHAGHDGA